MAEEQDATKPEGEAQAQPEGQPAEEPRADPQAEATPDGTTDETDGVGEPAGSDAGAANAALQAAQAAISALGSEAAAAGETDSSTPSPFTTPSFSPTDQDDLPKGLELLSDVDVNVTIELGRTRMLVEDVLRLAEGAVVELDKLAGDPVDVFVNERLVARGEVLVLNDNFCIRVNEILDADLVEDD